uniref:Tripartite motif-containing protein 2-like n=1 Tax=Crassostrea virginica TaxID=6565 RepID=A0A8B8CJT1_CRAVI|nr:tripartite motif-containing protein 2-like [Crassostrea virginica]
MATSVSSTGSDEDRTRFFRLSLVIIDELTQILRDLLQNEVPPTQILKKVMKVKHLTKTLRKDQIAIITNANTNGYQEFDIPLLYSLLRNVCQNITPPSQGWGVSSMPSSNEVTVGDDIERIRLIRNKLFGHISEAAISETEFKEHWLIISDICMRLQTLLNKDYVKRLQDAEDQSIDAATENKYIELIKRLIMEDEPTREPTSKEIIKIESRVAEKAPVIQTLINVSISVLNEMVGAVNEMTSESDIQKIYESLIEFIRDNKEEPENLRIQRLLSTLSEKITSYAKLQGPNRIRILANFNKFSLKMRKEYGAQVECFRSSIFLLVTFSCGEGFDLYKNDLENGRIGEQILELFLYPPFLESFGLKANDIEIYLNGRELTGQTGSLTLSKSMESIDSQYMLLDVVQCDICEAPVPPLHCNICHLNLCKACVGEHISNEFNNHKVVSFSRRGDIVNFPKCQTHCTKICEIHCKQCDIPICASCVSSGDHEHHRKEDNLKHLKNKKELIEKDLSELKKSIYPEYQKIATNLRAQRADVRKQSQKLTKAVDKQGEALHTEINTIIQGMKSKIDDMDAKNMTAIDKQEDKVKRTIAEITQVIKDLQYLLESDDVKLVFDYASKNEEFRNLPSQFHVTLPTLTPQEINKKIHEQISSLLDQDITFSAKQLIGDPSTTTKQHNYPMKTVDDSSSLSALMLIEDNVITTEERSGSMKVPSAMSSPPARPLSDDQSITTKVDTSPMKIPASSLSLPVKLIINDPPITTEKCGASSSDSNKQPYDDATIKTEKYSDPLKTLGAISPSQSKLLLDDPPITSKEHVGPMKTPGAVSVSPARQFIDDPRILADITTKYGNYPFCCVSCLSDSEIWTCGFDQTIALYNLQGEIVRSVETKLVNGPWSLAVTESGDVVYADRHRSIWLVRDTQIQTLITLIGWVPYYVCSTSSGDLLVFMTSDDITQAKVVRYSGSTEKQSIQWDDEGKSLYTPGYNFKYLCENRNLDICVTDNAASAVVVVSTAGKLRFRYTGYTSSTPSFFFPRGITTDSQGNILIADFVNNRIHIIDQDGNFLRYIDSCGLIFPYALCVDSRDNLFVAENDTGHLKKIQYYK